MIESQNEPSNAIETHHLRCGSNGDSFSASDSDVIKCEIPEEPQVAIETHHLRCESNGDSFSTSDLIKCEIPEEPQVLLVAKPCEIPEEPQVLLVPKPTRSVPQIVRHSQNTPTTDTVDSDPVKWVINEKTRDYIALHGFKQNEDADFSLSNKTYTNKTRSFGKGVFVRKLLNGEKLPRKWVIYSPSRGRIFCGPCLLFGGESLFGKQECGYDDWNNGIKSCVRHENSIEHRTCVLTLQRRSNEVSDANQVLASQSQEEELSYWREVLKRVVATVKLITPLGLPFKGHDEKLSLLQLIAEFDPFLVKHPEQYGSKGHGSINTLTSKTCDEFIEWMSNRILTQIRDEINISKYYSIILDSASDISHIDQITLMIRYTKADGTPVEHFLKFISNVGLESQDIADDIIETLDMLDINLRDCRGLSYDNAINMSGVYNRLLAKFKELCPQAEYVPCSAHSLNQVCECAAECTQEASRFFCLLQEIYTFFTASTQRWEILQAHILLDNDPNYNITSKDLTDKRWSSRVDVCKSLKESFLEIHNALLTIESNAEQKRSVVCEAKGIRLKLERLETTFMIMFWGFIMLRASKTDKRLQSTDNDISAVIRIYNSLIKFLSAEKENFDQFEQKALELSFVKEYEKDYVIRKRKLTAGGSDEGITSLTGRENFKEKVYRVILDRLVNELQERKEAYSNFHCKFSFFSCISKLNSGKVRIGAKDLVKMYPGDLENHFSAECVHLQCYLTEMAKNGEVQRSAVNCTPGESLQALRSKGLETIYPNVDIALRIYVSTAISICSGEEVFSCLKRVRNYLRSTINNDFLNSFAILNIESNLMLTLNYDDVIENFARHQCENKNV